MRVELLYFDGCPSHRKLLPDLEAILEREGLGDSLEMRRVETPEAAERERFLGSPTVRVDGQDIEPGASAREDFGLKCRLYRTEQGASGIPLENWITDALRQHEREVE